MIHRALQGATTTQLSRLASSMGYDLSRTVAEYHAPGMYSESCQDTIPAALVAVFSASSYEEAIRNSVVIGGDTDTIACIAGGIAEAVFGIPEHIAIEAYRRLPPEMGTVIKQVYARRGFEPCFVPPRDIGRAFAASSGGGDSQGDLGTARQPSPWFVESLRRVQRLFGGTSE